MLNAKTLNEDEFFYGHKACAGCGGSLAVRIAGYQGKSGRGGACFCEKVD